MKEQKFSKNELDIILTNLKYYQIFKDKYLVKKYLDIDYGNKIGKLTFESFFDTAIKYTYSNQITDITFNNWNKILNDEDVSEEELFCTILEIFVWGSVLTGNVKKAIELYKNKTLKSHIKQARFLLKSKEILPQKGKSIGELELLWSSGWTKVYSFIDNDVLIYDSRVSAFLNHTLTYEILDNEESIKTLKLLTKYLFNFKGNGNRERLVSKEFGFKNSHPNGVNGFNANLIASWIIELLKEKLNLTESSRQFERAFFMLGFDLKQI